MPPDPRSLFSLSSTEFVEPPPPSNKIPGYATATGLKDLPLLQNALTSCRAPPALVYYRIGKTGYIFDD